MPPKAEPPLKRFWKFVERGDCWTWTGHIGFGGYGRFGREGDHRAVLAHRWLYEHLHGPVADGLNIDHLCRNRACVRPSHLEPVTQRENVRRGAGHGNETHCPQGHPYSGDNLAARERTTVAVAPATGKPNEDAAKDLEAMASVALVTGCAGFIGRELTEMLLTQGHYVIGLDSLTYAARPDLLPNTSRFRFVEQDVNDIEHLHGASVVFHLAAESHVDNGNRDPGKFLRSNTAGTFHLLELLRGLRPHDRPTLIHMSTDEVYGPVPSEHLTREDEPLNPSSPYSASKAAADMLVLGWATTYGLKARIVRPSNCYGPQQYPEKLIPKTIRYAQLGRRMTVHGDGSQTRMWLSVEDCAKALCSVWAFGEDGVTYTVPGDEERSVRWVVTEIHKHYQALTGNTPLEPIWGCDRPGSDRAYRVDGELIRRLGWHPTGRFKDDLGKIVESELTLGVRI